MSEPGDVPPGDVPTKRFTAKQMGWVRHPQRDTFGLWAWEAPNGQIYVEKRGVMPTIERAVDLRDWPRRTIT